MSRNAPNHPAASPGPLQRRLAAILSADVQGYSRLMGDDEEQTVQTLTTYREVLTRLVMQYHGRIVDMPGDNVLAEFASVVDAVQGAVHIQQTLGERNAALPSHRRMEFRIGINLGDVIVEEGRLYGDGVNVAARLESLAPAGGICLSGTVYDQVEPKLPLAYQFLGEQRLKNIAKPVRAYQLLTAPSPSVLSSQYSVVSREDAGARRRTAEGAESQQPEEQPPTPSVLGQESQHESGARFPLPAQDPRPTALDNAIPLNPQAFHLLSSDSQILTPNTQPPTPFLIGRDAELQYLHEALAQALTGERQIIFVSGDPGIGKTTLIDIFLEHLKERGDVRTTHGQCVEQYGAGEAYLPLLEATARLCRAPGGAQRVVALQRYAPSWLAQLPSLVDPHQSSFLHQHLQRGSRERMLREMAEAAELFTKRRGLVVVLEDLHWSDTATLEWLAYMARRRETAKLLIIGTYRPSDMLINDHPLKDVVQELLARGQCGELRLTPFDEQTVQTYLAARLTGAAVPTAWTEALYRRTGGNPLFLVNMLDYFIQQGVVVNENGRWRVQADAQGMEREVPDTLRRLIEKQLERLPEEDRQLLEVASVEGREFVTIAVAAGLQVDSEIVEERCERLARKSQFLSNKGVESWPDGAIGGRYSFLHALYQNVLYERVAEARRIRLHRALGARKEQAYGKQAKDIAGELAAHFAMGRDPRRAVMYCKQAAETAVRRHAHQEAITHLIKGLELLQTLSDTTERIQHELGLQVMLAASLMAHKGYAAREVEQAYARAQALCQQVETTPHVFPVLRGLVSFYQVRARLQTARELGEQLLNLCQRVDDAFLQVQAHYGHGVTLFDMAEFGTSTAHLKHALALYTPQQHGVHVSVYGGYDPGVACLQWLARTLWLQGYPTQAQQRSNEAVQLARELGHPLSLAWAWNIAAVIHQYRGEDSAAQAQVQEALSIAREHELAFMTALATILDGWGLVGQGQRLKGMEQIRHGVAAYQSTGAALSLPAYFSLLAGAHARNGQIVEAQRLVEDAIGVINNTGERWFEAELYRIKGELTLYQQLRVDSHAEAEAYFLKALEIARQRQAKSWELRAAMSLARLWHGQGNTANARRLLEQTYSWFTEGFDTKDLRDAETLLHTLGSTIEQLRGGLRKAEDDTSPASSVQRLASEGQRQVRTGQTLAPRPSESGPSDPTPQPLAPSLFCQEGDYWTLTFAGTTCRLRDNRGLRYLAQLLQHPNEEQHVLQLAARDVSEELPLSDPMARGAVKELVNAEEGPQTGFSDAGEMLDSQARAAYKERLEDLRAELAETQERNDLGRAEALQEEIIFLTKELSQAVGLSGRVRRTGSVAERARVSVTKALKSALARINNNHPALGAHLTQTIKTGSYCVYAPSPRGTVTWEVSQLRLRS